MKSEKQTKAFPVPFVFEWTWGVEISKIREDLDALEKLGVTTIDIEPEYNYGSSSVSISAKVNRLETDEEFIERTEKEERYKKQTELRELVQLELLKKKYNK